MFIQLQTVFSIFKKYEIVTSRVVLLLKTGGDL